MSGFGQSGAALRVRQSFLIEFLEGRQYLSAVYLQHDPGINNYYFRVSGEQVQIFQNQALTNVPVQQVAVSDIGEIQIVNPGLSDSVTIDYSGGD